jgi:hypothetical protein
MGKCVTAAPPARRQAAAPLTAPSTPMLGACSTEPPQCSFKDGPSPLPAVVSKMAFHSRCSFKDGPSTPRCSFKDGPWTPRCIFKPAQLGMALSLHSSSRMTFPLPSVLSRMAFHSPVYFQGWPFHSRRQGDVCSLRRCSQNVLICVFAKPALKTAGTHVLPRIRSLSLAAPLRTARPASARRSQPVAHLFAFT